MTPKQHQELIKSNIHSSYNDLEKAAIIGEIREWQGGRYKKTANGQWVKLTETKTGIKEKEVAYSGMKKVIESERKRYKEELEKERSKFEEAWLKNNPEANLAFISFRIKLDQAKIESKDLNLAYQRYKEIDNDLQEDLQEVITAQEEQAKRKREELSGKKEISTKDDFFKSKFDHFNQLQRKWEAIPTQISASEALGEEVTTNNYWLNTDAVFEVVYEYSNEDTIQNGVWTDLVEKKWKEMKDSGKYEFTQSPKSSSEYLVDKESGKVFRKSDHWGRCASCYWEFTGNHNYGIGVSNVKDFKRNDSNSWTNPQYVKALREDMKMILEGLKQMVEDKSVEFDKGATKAIKDLSDKMLTVLKYRIYTDTNELEKIQSEYQKLFKL